ncbi:unnamed protein product (macronuclear) [Paramecium tetraurelia]|uniref:Protein kinase domain-containing protein n=1 Tax=Paramecium tetraurelia TaxID=5888 RepID=A0D2U3_PARTE|nr:uncharacterized protein GSPATT00012868001 [Paramecium tetraurelia]CAK77360.1 unnamed protein product [Paramecium tetraurelia]|eukprot:XP_001444757.1 hypothetical protein (macronuclear) [Paramecium tetraurelia strain d4-2]
MKKLKIADHVIFYSKSKSINCSNCQLERVKNSLVIQSGLKISKQGKYLEIFGEIDQLYDHLKKYCVQINFLQIYKLCSVNVEKEKKKIYKIRQRVTNDEKIAKVYELDGGDIQQINKEIQILRLLKHKNIVQMEEVYQEDNRLILVFDNLEGGDLAKIMLLKQFCEDTIRIIIKQILQGIVYLHDLGIFHRDLKPENILFKNQEQIEQLQIIDFALADFYCGENKYIFTRCGTPGYVAPEILQDKRYTLNVDVFSVGVILFMLLTQKNPFIKEQFNYEQIITANYDCQIDYSEVKCSTECLDLLKKCLKVDQHKRISARDALSHPFILGTFSTEQIQFRIKTQSQLQKQKSNGSLRKIIHIGSLDSPRFSQKQSIKSLHTESPIDTTSDSPGTPKSARTENRFSNFKFSKQQQWNSFRVSKFKK